MRLDPIFGLSILGSFAAFGLLARLYLWPWLRRLSREEALRLLVLPHMFRFAGLSFLVTGVVSPALPASFAVPAAYGDLGAAILAIATIFALSARAPSRLARPITFPPPLCRLCWSRTDSYSSSSLPTFVPATAKRSERKNHQS